MEKQLKDMRPLELKAECFKIRALLEEKGITHPWDFVRAFYPKTKFKQAEFRSALYGQVANAEVVKVLRDVLNKIQ